MSVVLLVPDRVCAWRADLAVNGLIVCSAAASPERAGGERGAGARAGRRHAAEPPPARAQGCRREGHTRPGTGGEPSTQHTLFYYPQNCNLMQFICTESQYFISL